MDLHKKVECMNRGEKRNLTNKKDTLIIIAILLASLLGMYAASAGGKADGGPDESSAGKFRAYIFYKGISVRAVNLDQDLVFDLEHNPEVRFEVKDGAIAFIHSNCPDQLCVGMGWLDKPGDFAACLPNQVMLLIEYD